MKPQQTMIVKVKANLHDHCDNHCDEHCATLYNCCDIHAVIIVDRVHPHSVSCFITHLLLNRLQPLVFLGGEGAGGGGVRRPPLNLKVNIIINAIPQNVDQNVIY